MLVAETTHVVAHYSLLCSCPFLFSLNLLCISVCFAPINFLLCYFFHSLLYRLGMPLSHLVIHYISPLSLSVYFCLILLQSQAPGPTEVQTVGATARRASPRMMRCSLSPASEATPARPPRNPTPLLLCLPPLHPLRKWIFLVLMGR